MIKWLLNRFKFSKTLEKIVEVEPVFCADCQFYLPDKHFRTQDNQCRYAKCAYTYDGTLNPVFLVCPNFSDERVSIEEMTYCSTMRTKSGNYCPHYRERQGKDNNEI